jgi:ubiquinone/menaquinone biosynthesis C-methylase UbiE
MTASCSCLAVLYRSLLNSLHWSESQLAIAEGIAGRILEAGCGTAQLTLNLLERGLDVYGCDLSLAMVEVAQDNLEIHGHDPGRLLVGDITRMPFADDSFDYVLITGVLGLMSLRDQRVAMREMLRVCRHGLRLLEPLVVRPRFYVRWTLTRWLWHIRPVPEEQLVDLQISYRIGWSTRAAMFSYVQIEKHPLLTRTKD